jgi:hypothetical protein
VAVLVSVHVPFTLVAALALAVLRRGARLALLRNDASSNTNDALAAIQPHLSLNLGGNFKLLSSSVQVVDLDWLQLANSALANAQLALPSNREVVSCTSVAMQRFFHDERASVLGARVEWAQISTVLRGLLARVPLRSDVDRVCFVASVDSPLFVPLALALPLVARVTLVALSPDDFASIDALRDAVRLARPTVLIAPPRWLVLLADTFAACHGRRLALAHSLPATRAVRRRFAALCDGVPIVQLFGWIETAALGTVQRLEHAGVNNDDAGAALDDTTLEIDAEAANEVIVTGAHVNGALMDESYLASDENNEFAATRALDMSLDADRRATGTFGALNAHGALDPMPWWHEADRLDPDARIDVLRVHSSLAAHPLCRAARPFLTPSGAVVAAVAIDRAQAPQHSSAVDAVQTLVRECNADFVAQYGFSIVAVGLLWRDVALASVGEPFPTDLWLSDAEQARLFAAAAAATAGSVAVFWFDEPPKASSSAATIAAPVVAPAVAADTAAMAARLAELEQQCVALVEALSRQPPPEPAAAAAPVDDGRVKALQSQLDSMRATLEEVEAERDDANATRQDAELASLKSSAAAIDSEKRAAALEAALTAANVRVGTLEKQASAGSDAASARADALAAELATANAKLTANAEAATASLTTERARAEALATELAAAKGKLVAQEQQASAGSEAATARADALAAELATLTANAAAAAASLTAERTRAESLATELATAQGRLVAQEQQASDVATSERECADALAAELSTANAKLASDAAAAAASLTTERTRAESLVAELTLAKSRLAAHEQQLSAGNDAASSALASERARSDALAAELATARSDYSASQERFKADSDSLTSRVQALQADATRWQSDATNLAQATAALEKQTVQVETLDSTLTQVRTELAKAADRETELLGEIEAMRELAQKGGDEKLERLLKEVEELNTTRVDNEQRIGVLLGECTDLQFRHAQQLVQKDEAIAALKTELDAVHAGAATAGANEAEMTALRDELATLRGTADAAATQVTQLQAELAAARNSDAAESQMQQLREENDAQLTLASTRIVELNNVVNELTVAKTQHTSDLSAVTAERDRQAARILELQHKLDAALAAAAAAAATPAADAAVPVAVDEQVSKLQTKLIAVQTERDQLRLVLSEKKQAGDVELVQVRAQLDDANAKLTAAKAKSDVDRADAAAQVRAAQTTAERAAATRLAEVTATFERQLATARVSMSVEHEQSVELTDLRATVLRLTNECERLRADLARAKAYGSASADEVAPSTIKVQRQRQAMASSNRASAFGTSPRGSAPTSPLRAQTVQRTPSRPRNPRVVLELRGVGLSHALANTDAQFTLRARAENGARVPTVERLRERLTYELEERQTGASVLLLCDGGVTCDNDDVLFTFNYRPLHSGAHRMRLRVDGNDVVGSPFTIVVPAQVSKLQQPSVVPSPSAHVPATPSRPSPPRNGDASDSPLRHASPLSGLFKASSVDEQLAGVLTSHATLGLVATKVAPDRFRLGKHEVQLRSIGSLLTVREADGERFETPITLEAWLQSEFQSTIEK